MWNDFKKWAQSPFSATMPWYEWGAFLGLLMVAVIFWNIILAHITGKIGS